MLSSRKGLMIWFALSLVFSVIIVALVTARRFPPENPERRLSVYDRARPGVVIVNGNPFWCPGTRHPDDPHLYAGNRNGVWCADDGYAVDTNEGVRAIWNPGAGVKEFANLRTGQEEGVFMVKQNCQKCHGTGKRDVQCPDCAGLGGHSERIVCPDCGGARKVVCSVCDSSGMTKCTGLSSGGSPCNGKCRSNGCHNGKSWFGFGEPMFPSYLPNCSSCDGSAVCSRCKGSGRTRCYKCDGTRSVGCRRCRNVGYWIEGGRCKTCSHKGMLSEKCDACEGKGFLWVRATSEMSQLVVRNCKARCARQQDAALSTAAQNSLPRIVTYTIMTKEEREEARRIALEKQARDEENSRKITLLLQQQAQLDALRQQMMMNVIQNNMQLQQQMNQALMNQMMMNQSSFASPAIAPAPVNVPRMNTKRFCPRHGEWDTRGGTFSCPGCNGPKFGLSDPVGDLIDALK